MTDRQPDPELEIRSRSQELAVAWRKGRAAFVLDRLAAEEPLVAALMATVIHESLAAWDPFDSKWPNGFRRALLLRAQGAITPDEVRELEREYRRRFGSSPPRLPKGGPIDARRAGERMELQVERIRAALASGRPLLRRRPGETSPDFLRLRPARHGGGSANGPRGRPAAAARHA